MYSFKISDIVERRIGNEIAQLSEMYDTLRIDDNVIDVTIGKTTLRFVLDVKNSQNIDNYPFASPTVYVFDRNFSQIEYSNSDYKSQWLPGKNLLTLIRELLDQDRDLENKYTTPGLVKGVASKQRGGGGGGGHDYILMNNSPIREDIEIEFRTKTVDDKIYSEIGIAKRQKHPS